MSKKIFLAGVLIGAGLVIGGVTASKNEKVQGKINDVKNNERVKLASEQVKSQVTKVKESESLKKAVVKSKEVGSTIAKKVKNQKEAPADYSTKEIVEDDYEA